MAIDITSNFNVGAALPIDARTTAANTTVRDAIPSGKRFLGLQCYVASDTKTYVLKAGITNADWVELGASGGATAITELTGDVTATGPGSSIATIADLPFSKLLATVPNQAIISDANGKLQNSGVTVTELNLLSGKTTLATLAGVESLSNKTFIDPNTNVEILADQASTPPAPAAGKTKIYTKASDGQLYKLTSAGVESKIGSGSIDNTGSVTVKDANLTIQDDADVTKQAKFEASAIVTNTTATFTLPSASQVLVGNSAVQTLTNKTLTGPIVNGGNVTMSTAANNNRIIIPTAPTATLNGLTNVAGSVAYDTTLGKMVYNDATQWNAIGGRGAVINYAGSVWDGTAPAKFVPYKEAGALPTSGTGGTTTGITSALNTTLPLSGSQNIRLSKASGVLTGGGWAFGLTIDKAYLDRGVPINVRLQTRTSVNYAAGDVKVYVVDITAATVQAVLTNNIDSSIAVGTSEFNGQFTPSANATYRLVFHITSANTLAYDIDVAQMVVGPQMNVPGAIITPWVQYTPTFTNFGTVTALAFYSRRVGDSLEIRGVWQAPSPQAAVGQVTMGFNGVNANVICSPVGGSFIVGHGNSNPTSTTFFGGIYPITVANQNYLVFAAENSTTGGTSNGQNATAYVGANGFINFYATVQIAGWSAGNQISTTDALMSSAKFTARKTSVQAVSSTAVTKVTWQTIAPDNIAGWDAANNRYIIRKTGRYEISFGLLITAGSAENFAGRIYVNGVDARSIVSTVNIADTSISLSVPLDLFVNDYIEIFVNSSADIAYNVANSSFTWFSIDQLPDLSVFGTTGRFEYLATTSATKTPAGSAHYAAMTGNSIPLTPGTWDLSGLMDFRNSGSGAGYTQGSAYWFGSNGNDTGATPTALSALAGVTILSASFPGFAGLANLSFPSGTVEAMQLSLSKTVIRVTQPVTVYMVPFYALTTAANGRVTAYANAQRLQ